jgi:hypothetical protein
MTTHNAQRTTQLTLIAVLLSLFNTLPSFSQTAVSRLWSDTFGLQDTSFKTPVATNALLQTFIAGTENNPNTGIDISLRKLDDRGNLLWQASYSGSGAYRDQATDIALDDSGNVYLCGLSYVSGHHYDLLVLKFNSSGNLLWDYTLNGTASQADGATALAVDSGHVFVTGALVNASSFIDFVTLRLSGNGILQWQNQYNHVQLADIPFDISVTDGNVFISGASQNNLLDWDYLSLQLKTHLGTPVDTLRTGGTGIGFDHAAEAYNDDAGHYYITGTVQNAGHKDFKTIKFDANLNVLWTTTFNHQSQDDEAASLTVDQQGNVYVAGTSRENGTPQFTIVKYNSNGVQQWVHRSNLNSKAARITHDDQGNVFACGEAANANADFYTLALDSAGNILWHKFFNGASNGQDRANMIQVQGEHVMVSGTTEINGQLQYITIAYGTFKIETPPDTSGISASTHNYFYPQLGQILDDTSGVADIQYYTLHHGPALFLKNEQMSMVWAKSAQDSIGADTLQRIDQIIYEAFKTDLYEYKESPSYLNYYLPHCANGITQVHGFQWLSIPNIYPDMDMYYSFNQAGIRQMFVTKPQPSRKPSIQLQYLGADTVVIDSSDGSLEIFGQIGSIKFSKPYAYEIDALGNIIPGTLFYPHYRRLSTGIISIDSLLYNASNGLVVVMDRWGNSPSSCSAIPSDINQGNLFHSTFYGMSAPLNGGAEIYNEYSSGIVNDNAGNVYLSGFSNTYNFPASQGASQSFGAGSMDGFILCFDNNMVRQWATLIGGSQADSLTCITFNENDGALYFGGTTLSSNFPAFPAPSLPNAYFDGVFNGQSDAIFGRILTDGTFSLVSFIGGSGSDKLMDIGITGDNIVAIGNTRSTNTSLTCSNPSNGAFPICGSSGNFLQNFNAGGQDIFIMKFEPDNSLSWSTLLGSNADDKIFDIEPYPVFRSVGSYFYICGETQKSSSTGPFNGSVLSNGDMPLKEPSASAFFQSVNGGLLIQFDNLGNMIWGTTFRGVKDLQALTFTNNSIYAAGRSNSSSLASNTCLEDPSEVSLCYTSSEFGQNSGDLYLGRFSTSGQMLYATKYNGSGPYGMSHLFNLPHEKAVFMDSNLNGDIFIESSANPNPNFPLTSFEPFPPVWPGCYYQSNPVVGPMGSSRYKCTILSFNSLNQRNWATLFGSSTSQGTSGTLVDWPLFEDFPGGITCYQNKDIFIAGYSGKDCFAFPLVDAGITPTGQSYFHDDQINSFQNTGLLRQNTDYDAFIAKFDMQSVAVGSEPYRSSRFFNNAVFPNITDGDIIIQIHPEFCNSANIQLLNASGLVIREEVNLNCQTALIRKWNISDVSKGLYFVRILGENGQSESFKIIKK